ncbi:hypothetical protein D3C75_1111880 [compost metagenome]
MVDAELSFAETVAAVAQLAVFDVVVRAQVAQATVERGLADRITRHHPLHAQLVILAVAVLLEVVVRRLGQGAVLALAVAVADVPPAERQVVVERGIVRGLLVVANGVVATSQHQLVSQPQRTVPLQ